MNSFIYQVKSFIGSVFDSLVIRTWPDAFPGLNNLQRLGIVALIYVSEILHCSRPRFQLLMLQYQFLVLVHGFHQADESLQNQELEDLHNRKWRWFQGWYTWSRTFSDIA